MTKIESAAIKYAEKYHIWLKDAIPSLAAMKSFKDGAEWQNANLWHDAQGDDLPPIDEEVIVLCISGKVCFGHRPNPKGFNCKNVDTGKMEYLKPMTYGKGGWNIPDVRWWLDESIPNLEDKQ
jgi:hypothetical protein